MKRSGVEVSDAQVRPAGSTEEEPAVTAPGSAGAIAPAEMDLTIEPGPCTRLEKPRYTALLVLATLALVLTTGFVLAAVTLFVGPGLLPILMPLVILWIVSALVLVATLLRLPPGRGEG